MAGGKKKDKDSASEQAVQEKGKPAGKESKNKDKAKGVISASSSGSGGAGSFRLPASDKTFHVVAPPLRPPPLPSGADDGEDPEEESYVDVAPRKLQLDHIPLLTHPVLIGAIDNFLSEDECRRWIEWGEKSGFEEAKQKQTVEYAHRDNGRIQVESDEIAQLLWLRIRPFVPASVAGSSGGKRQALGCSPRIRLYRYNRGQRFGQHIDGSCDEPSFGGRTHHTVLIYLNGGDRDIEADRKIRGGETVFWKDRGGNPTTVALAFPPTRGVCLFHGHGDECMIHEGTPVESGIKYVLRTDVVYEP